MTIVADQPLAAPAPPLSLRAQQRLRGQQISGNGPGGRVLGRGEDIRVGADASARMAELYAEYGGRLVHYARRKLVNRGTPADVAVHLAEEIAQETWVEIARTGAKDLLAPAGRYSEDETRWMLWRRVKDRILAHYKRSASYETVVDWEDRTTCALLCPVLEQDLSRRCSNPLPGYLASMLATLPEPEREALLTLLYDVPSERAAELLRELAISGKPQKLIARAVLLLLIDNPELSDPRASLADLPAWEREAFKAVTLAQRELLLRLDTLPRQILLLHAADGLNSVQIAERLGVPRSRVLPVLSGCAALLVGVSA